MLIRFLVYNIYGVGGTVRTVANMANSFVKNGYEVEIISIRQTAKQPTLHINKEVKLTPLFIAVNGMETVKQLNKKDLALVSKKSRLMHPDEDLYKMFTAYTDKQLLEVLKSLRGGVLITTFPSLNYLSAKYVDDSVIKIGQEHKGLSDHSDGIKKMIIKSYGKLDGLTVLTKKNYSFYRDMIKNKNVNIVVLGNGTKRYYHLSPLKDKVILSAGRYTEQKGFDMLIKAFSLLSSEFPDWKVKIFGSGSLKDEYKELINKHGLERQVFLCPSTDQLTTEISKSAFYVCSSYYEPFGMILIEAMAVGVPTVSFACEGPSEIIDDGKDGLLVPQQDIEGLAAAMKRLMADYDYRRQLGRESQIKSEKYSNENISKVLLNLIEKCNKKKHP